MERRVSIHELTWLLGLYENKQLNMNPKYQRRAVWSPKERRFFLDTIFSGYPSPAIFLHKTLDENGRATYDVVDGKQRLETIFMFVNNKIPIDKEFADVDLRGKKWRLLTQIQKRQLWDYLVPVEQITQYDAAVVDEVFARFNRNVKKLERQELRHAKFSGWFITFVENETRDSFWQTVKVVTTGRSRRMADVQFVSELLISTILRRTSGFDQDELDDFYSEYDDPEETQPDFDIDAAARNFETIKSAVRTLIESDNGLIDYLSTTLHLYTLWSCLSSMSEQFETVGHRIIAQRLKELFAATDRIRTDPETATSISSDLRDDAKTYAGGAVGATTESGQRLARHRAMVHYVFNHEFSEVSENEDTIVDS